MKDSRSGFTLVEIAIVLTIFGVLVAFSVPALTGMTKAHQLKGAVENVSGQLRLARQIAIGTGSSQTMHFTYNWLNAGVNSDFHIHNLAVGATWKLPRGVTYQWLAGTSSSYTFGTDGRANGSGLVILQDDRGNRDTVSVLSSGLILTK